MEQDSEVLKWEDLFPILLLYFLANEDLKKHLMLLGEAYHNLLLPNMQFA